MTDRAYSYVRCRWSDAKHFERLGYEMNREQRGIAALWVQASGGTRKVG